MGGDQKTNRKLMTEDELAELRAKFDLPDHVVDYVRHQPRLGAMEYGTGLAVFIVLAAGLAVWPLAVHTPEFGRLLINAGLLPENTILFKLGVASMVAAMFGGFFLAAFLFYMGVRFLPGVYIRSIISSLYSTVNPAQRYKGLIVMITKGLLKKIGRDLQPEEYLRRFEHRQTGLWSIGALVVYVVAIALFALDLKSMARVTPDGVTMSPYLSRQVLRYEWNNVVGIRTGCSTTGGGRSKSHVLKYQLRFGDNRTANLGTFRSPGMSRLDALEIVDGKLSALGVPKVRGEFDQSCLNAKRREFGNQDFERLQQIL